MSPFPTLDELWPKPRFGRLGEPLPMRSPALPDGVTDALDVPWHDVGGDEPPRVVRDTELRPQHYRLTIDEHETLIVAGDDAGVYYALLTLRQWVLLHRRAHLTEWRACHIEDGPIIAKRGVLLDISRGKVPKLRDLKATIDLLASLKINELQLYTEHTFAYEGHEQVWQGADPLTPEEIQFLDAYCRERYITLTPNQNSFGHFHRWLVHEPYRALAECPEGVEHPFSFEREPFTLCPVDPGSLELLTDLYDQLLPHFSSATHFNVGLDETFELGSGRSREAVEAKGRGGVYVEYLKSVHKLVIERGKRMQFWGDVILNHPEQIHELPKDVVPMAWGYEADHPFDEELAKFSATGLSFYVCPGTSSWQSFVGRYRNARLNLAHAAKAAERHGAAGYLITDWGDFGHLQPAPVAWTSFLLGAGFAWNVESTDADVDVPAQLDRWIYDDRPGVLGTVACEAGDVYYRIGEVQNRSALFGLVRFPDALMTDEQLSMIDMEGVQTVVDMLETTRYTLAHAKSKRKDGGLVQAEWRWAIDMTAWVCNLAIARLERPNASIAAIPESQRDVLRAGLMDLIYAHRGLWSRRYRHGGLDVSCEILQRLVTRLS